MLQSRVGTLTTIVHRNLKRVLGILALAAGFGSGATALAQDPRAADEERPIEEVVTVGTRSTRERTVTETPVPVDIINNDEIMKTGIVETSRLLQFLAPSFNFSTSTISDGTDIVRPSTLRGLGPDQTLVLVNGKRRHNSALVHVNGSIGRGTAGVDLNAIPPSAIDRIEILRDGAAAQYGSDAIAGVINIILKNRSAGTDLAVNSGSTYEGDGDTVQASVNHGFRIRGSGYLNLTAELRNRGDTNRAGPDLRQQYAEIEPGVPDPREATFDRINHRYGDPDSDNLYFFANAAIPIDDRSELYFFGGISGREGESGGFFRRALDERNQPAIYPDGFLPLINTNVDDYSAAVGVTSTLGAWNLDVSLLTGESSFEFIVTNSQNASFGPNIPPNVLAANAGELRFGQDVFNLGLVRDLDLGWLNPVSLAIGAEWRRDNYEIAAGQFESYANGPDDDPATAFPDQYGGVAAPGIQVFPGFRPSNEVDESRHNWAIYADLEADWDRFALGLAGRFEDFSDFGSTFNGKLTGRLEAAEGFAFRASGSTGFRAPSLHQQFFNNTSTQFVTVGGVPNTPVEVGTFANGSPVANAFGVPELKQETSVNLGFGFTWSPTARWLVTADAYRVDIEDRIVISGRFTDDNPVVAEILEPFPGVAAAQFFSNAIDTETNGVDLVASYIHDFGDGSDLKLTGAVNFTETELDGEVRTPAPLLEVLGAGETIFSRQEIIWLEDGQPKDHLNLAANYNRGPFSALLRFNRIGEVTSTESAADPATDQTFSAKWLADLDLSWTFRGGVSVSLGGNNLFDTLPDENIPFNSFGGIFPYNRRTTPFGFNGGYYYLELSYTTR